MAQWEIEGLSPRHALRGEIRLLAQRDNSITDTLYFLVVPSIVVRNERRDIRHLTREGGLMNERKRETYVAAWKWLRLSQIARLFFSHRKRTWRSWLSSTRLKRYSRIRSLSSLVTPTIRLVNARLTNTLFQPNRNSQHVANTPGDSYSVTHQ